MSLTMFAEVALFVAGVLLWGWWARYKASSDHEDLARCYGLVRASGESLSAWERRIFLANREACDSSKALVDEAQQLGLFRTFPPRQRPSMPEGVTWTTGIAFYPTHWEPYIAWLPNTHPLAVRYRLAKGPDYEGTRADN